MNNWWPIFKCITKLETSTLSSYSCIIVLHPTYISLVNQINWSYLEL